MDKRRNRHLHWWSSRGKGQLSRGSSLHWWRKCSVAFCTTHIGRTLTSLWAFVTFPFHHFAFRYGTHHVVCATRQKELFTLVKEALQDDIPLCITRVGHMLASLCTGSLWPFCYNIVTFLFTTLCSGRGLIMWFVFMLVKEALWDNIVFCTTCVGHTLASLCTAPLWPFRYAIVTFFVHHIGFGQGMRFVQLTRGSSLQWWRKRSDTTFRSWYLAWDRQTDLEPWTAHSYM